MKMFGWSALCLLVVSVSAACGITDTITGQKITTTTFEPVYRAAKTVQGATASGVTYVKFGELLQGLSTEIGIAKDKSLTSNDKLLLEVYEHVNEEYQKSQSFWKLKIESRNNLASDLESQMQDAWSRADKMLQRATEVFYGRQNAADLSTSPPLNTTPDLFKSVMKKYEE